MTDKPTNPVVIIDNGTRGPVEFTFYSGEAGIAVYPKTPTIVRVAFRPAKKPRIITDENRRGTVLGRAVSIIEMEQGEVPGFIVLSATYIEE